MKYRLFLIMATFVGLGSINTSCSRDNEPVVSDGDQKTPISFNVNVGTLPAPKVTTRGELDNKTTGAGYYFDTDDKICIAIKGVSGSSRDKTTEDVKTYKVLAANAGSTHAAPAKTTLTYDGTATDGFQWLSTSEKIALRAWSNGTTTAATDPLAKDGSSVTIPYELETDQATNGYKELLYYSNSSINYNASGIDIPLYHQLSRIVATIVVEDATAGTPSVTIGNNSDGNRVPVKATFAESSTSYGSWTVAAYTTESTHWGVVTPRVESTTPRVYSAVIIPGTGTDVYKENLRLFNITLGTKTFAYKLPTGGQTFEAGKQYNYTITVGNKGITVTSNITDWTDAADGTDFTHGDGLAVLKDIKMNPLWYVALYNMTNAQNASTLTMASSINAGYYYSAEDAIKTFSNDAGASQTAYYKGNKTISGVDGKWHLPTAYEYNSIVPGCVNATTAHNNTPGVEYYTITNIVGSDGASGLYPNYSVYLSFGYNDITKGIGGSYMQENSYWYRKTAREIYAVRYCGTNYCSIWKYERTGNSSSNSLILTITCKLLVTTLTTDQANSIYGSDESKWSAEFENLDLTSSNSYIDITNGAVRRQFYGLGNRASTVGSGSTPSDNGDKGTGWYYSATLGTLNNTTQSANVMWFRDDTEFAVCHGSSPGFGFNVRLFRDN